MKTYTFEAAHSLRSELSLNCLNVLHVDGEIRFMNHDAQVFLIQIQTNVHRRMK